MRHVVCASGRLGRPPGLSLACVISIIDGWSPLTILKRFPVSKMNDLKKFYRMIAADERNTAVLKPARAGK